MLNPYTTQEVQNILVVINKVIGAGVLQGPELSAVGQLWEKTNAFLGELVKMDQAAQAEAAKDEGEAE